MAGEATAGARASGNGQGVLIKDVTTGLTYLVVNGHRHQLWESRTVIPALFGAVVTPAPVGTAWINTLPAGVPISPITINNRGTDSKSVTGRKIGDLLVVQTGSGPQHYLVFDDGIAPITQLQKNIIDAQFPGKDPAQVSVGDINKAKRSSRLTTPEETTPRPRPSRRSWTCSPAPPATSSAPPRPTRATPRRSPSVARSPPSTPGSPRSAARPPAPPSPTASRSRRGGSPSSASCRPRLPPRVPTRSSPTWACASPCRRRRSCGCSATRRRRRPTCRARW
ncbi:hypothetical protein GCM10027610_090810 [Dactylosporangium cerinum]